MDHSIITLNFHRNDGRIEQTKLKHHSLSGAHEAAQHVLHLGNGLYTDAEIYTENGYVETVHNDDANDDTVGATRCKVWTLRIQ